jgi:hypothetical protein
MMLARRKANGRWHAIDEEQNRTLFTDADWQRALKFLQRDGLTRAEAIAVLVSPPLPVEWSIALNNARRKTA